VSNKNYLYFPSENRLINKELQNQYQKFAQEHTVNVYEHHIDQRFLEEKIKQLPVLVLEVTEQCNLRCKYCVYNGQYDNYRSRSPKTMTLETARKGIEFIYSYIKDRAGKDLSISLYGGEPLSDVGKLEEIVTCSKKIMKGWDLHYSLTSNFTTLTEEAIDFLLDNDVRLVVSLDGDRDNHDAKRIFADGSGSHHMVMKNLKKIHQRDPDYFQKITISAVHSFDLPLQRIIEFFSRDPLVSQNGVRFSTVSQFNTNYYETYPFDVDKNRDEYSQLSEDIYRALRKGVPLSNVQKFFLRGIIGFDDALKVRDFPMTAQTCFFNSRIFIDTQGRLHTCERINNTFPIGDIENGFDFPRMVNMVNDYTRVVKENCLNCSVCFLCERCFVPLSQEGEFAIPPGFCESRRKSIIEELERYIQFKEEGLIE
jgi:uncharacterized protein